MTNFLYALYMFVGFVIGYSIRELWENDETDYEADPPLL